MKQRLTALILALTLIFALLPAAVLTASADIVLPPDDFDDIVSGTCGDLAWELNKTTGVLTINGIGAMTEAPWLEYTGKIRTVVIEDGVTSVGYGAFQLCTRLTSITIPDSVIYIDYNAFAGCTGLTELTIPGSVTAIGGGAFTGCSGLTSLTIPGSVTRIGDNAFRNCTGLTEVTLEDGVETVGLYAFGGCAKLKEVTIPESVTAIGGNAFADCTELADVYYGGIQAKWDKLDIGDGNECLTDAKIHCIDCTHKNTHDEHMNATCTDAGYDRTVCDDCGEIVSETAIPALGHDIVIIDEIPATCTASGWTAGEYCTRCDYTVRPEYVDALGHDWDEGKVTIEPTETEKGEKTFTCLRCGETRTETIPELSHVHNYIAVVTDPTCTEQGFTTHTCECGASYVDTYVDALGHDLVRDDPVPATCTETGLTAGEHCARCDYKVAQEEVAALGHDWDEGKVTTQPTATKDGVKTFNCKRCGATRTETVPAAGGEPANPFTDVAKTDYFYDAVLWAYDSGVTTGLDATHFGPYATCTRGQIVTFLWRALGEPAPTITKNPFADVKESDYYYKAVLWAFENGVTTGTDATHFAPNAFCKREHAVAFLYRAAGKPAYTNKTNPFVDVSASAYYYDAVLWAVEKNITKGMDATHFGPSNSCQRCQIVTFLYRFMNP